MPFSIVEHPADIGFRFSAPSRSEAFRQAVRALTFLLVGDSEVHDRENWPVEAAGDSSEELLYALLTEILFLFDARHFLTRELEIVRLEEGRVQARAHGERFDPARHLVQNYVKAITFHQFSLTEGPDGLEGRVYVDI